MLEKKIDISIIVPILNEELNIIETLDIIIISCENLGLEYQIIVVDDYSTDSSYDLVKSKFSCNKNLELYKNPNSQGLGSAYAFGLKKSNGVYTTWVPGDNQHPVNGLMQVYSFIHKYDFLIMQPINPEVRNIKRRIISNLYTKILNLITGFNIPYYNGLNVYKTDILNQMIINNNSFGFQAQILVNFINKNLTYKIIKAELGNREFGNSRAFTLKNLINIIKTFYFIYLTVSKKR